MRNGIELRNLLQKLQRTFYGSKQALIRGSGLMTTIKRQAVKERI
jgi:hypothetical protein